MFIVPDGPGSRRQDLPGRFSAPARAVVDSAVIMRGTMNAFDRRRFLAVCSSLGLSSTLFPGVLWSMAQQKTPPPGADAHTASSQPTGEPLPPAPGITPEMITAAATLAGITIDDKQREMMISMLRDNVQSYRAVRRVHLDNAVQSALTFDPVLPGMQFGEVQRPLQLSQVAARGTPRNAEQVAFAGARELGELLRTRKLSSTSLTEMYLERLHRFDPTLKFVITFCDDRARAQAREADREIAAGKYRGPLHGLPWGAKDMLAVRGYRTTWGAGGFEEQRIDQDATVVQRLDAAGAVLLCKTTLGALANGDVWFGGMTRNPWKPDQGSSGSSAGSASATAAGCVAFSIGSETLGSIASPSDRCGDTGLRPTFGRVPRTGAMALCWSMDHLGPICRSVEDCAMVLHAIQGADGRDRSARSLPFNWDANYDFRRLRVGYVRGDFEDKTPPPPANWESMTAEERAKDEKERERARRDSVFLRNALETLGGLGVRPVSADLPKLPVDPLQIILLAESAAAFDEFTRSGRDRLLTAQAKDDWPNTWRVSRFIPAVEYVNANRVRLLLMQAMAELFREFDVLLAATYGDQLTITNLTGHPALILPNGFRPDDGTPVSMTLVGNLFDEGRLLSLARAYQEATGFHLKHPPQFSVAGE
jgi:Asp-tRNA(Asn)/Glu-tRNA(Gln) amidotransferase A subunit family amidase